MKIKKVEFCNLNSLKGKWEIDFTKFDNIFLITGPTGSGKTTILDAICVSLYHKTPRLKNAEALVTKGEKEAYAICEFEIKNKTYQASWKIKKGKKNTIKVALKEGKELIADKVKEVQKQIENLSGFDFDRFTKSMMLTQGGFDKFLKAKKEEKAILLEELTGSQIYGLISSKVYEKFKEEKIKLETLKSQVEEVDENKLLDLKEKFVNFEKELKKIDSKLKQKEEKKKKFDEFNKLNLELKNFKEELSKIDLSKFDDLEEKKRKLEIVKIKNEKIEFLKKDVKKFDLKKIEDLQEELNELENKDLKIIDLNEYYEKLSILKEQFNRYLEYKKAQEEIKTIDLDNLRQLRSELSKKREEVIKRIDKLQKEMLYEKARKELKEGEPCPLCGSLNHPYVKNLKLEENSEIELKKELQNIEEELISVNSEIEFKQKRLNELKNIKQVDGVNEKDIKDLEEKIKELKENNTKNQKLKERLNELKALNLDSLKEKLIELKKEEKEVFNLVGDFNVFKKEVENAIKEFEKLKNKEIELKANIKNIKEKLNSFDEVVEIKEDEINFLKQEKDKLQKNIGFLENEIKHLEEKINKQKELQKEISKKEEHFKYLAMLNDLIGQQDGGKFRKFVQDLTLNYLISLANNHLKNFTDRYLLSKKEDLNLEIIDLYQANAKRDIATLSGGESFLVSLSLALGLTDLVSDKVRIETLFIDEGFGTLDENNLNIVIDALERLQASGKMVGIISHVKILKERILDKIKVKKVAGGYSKIEI